MNEKLSSSPIGHIIFDHDGTLVNTDFTPFTLFTGMRELLRDLKVLNFELYVWTSRPRRSTVESLKKQEIANFFTDIYCFDDGIPKPHTMGLKILTDGVPKDQILHIGDSMTDIEGAKAYGIEVIAACWNSPDQVEKYSQLADCTAININDCKNFIKRKFHV